MQSHSQARNVSASALRTSWWTPTMQWHSAARSATDSALRTSWWTPTTMQRHSYHAVSSCHSALRTTGKHQRLCSRIVRHAMFLILHCGQLGVPQRLCGGIVTPALLLILHCGQVGGYQLCSGIVSLIPILTSRCGQPGGHQRFCCLSQVTGGWEPSR